MQKGEFTLISHCVSTISRTLVSESTHHLLNMFQIIEVLETSGYENLITFAHGDAKPNNFMFRNIEIDIEDLVSWPLTSFQPKIQPKFHENLLELAQNYICSFLP